MADRKKVEEIISSSDKIWNLLSEFKTDEKVTILEFSILGTPESYARERKGRGSHFYNPKGDKMKSARIAILKGLSKENYNYTRELVSDPNKDYTVEIKCVYNLPIPKGDSIKLSAAKALGIVKPQIRPDIDNYDKFVLDTLHEIAYDDDKRVVHIDSVKLYSLDPSTDITVKIYEKITK